MKIRRILIRLCINFQVMKDREIRIALYSTFVGAIFGVSLLLLILNHQNIRETKHCPRRKAKDPQKCPLCPEVKPEKCPAGSSGDRLQLSRDIMDFVDEHMVAQRQSPLLVAWTRLKSTPNYYLSLPPPEKDSIISHAIITKGTWNDDVIANFCHWMSQAPEGSYFVDVGAYVGTVALGVAACGYSVLAYEPHKANFKLLRESVALNPSYTSNVWIYQTALGNVTDGTTCVSASSSEQGNARIVPGTSLDYQCPQGTVPITTLDSVTKDLHIWAINIDVQGFDSAVLAGAWRHISGRSPPKFLRFKVESGVYNWQSLSTEVKFEDFLGEMQKLGYSLRDEDNDIVVNVERHLVNVGHFATYMTAVFHGKP